MKPSASTRRRFLKDAAVLGAALPWLANSSAQTPPAKPNHRMTLNLVCGAIGVSANQEQAIDLARRHGFGSVEAYGSYLAALSPDAMRELLQHMKTKGVSFGAAGLPVEFRQDDAQFDEGLKQLPNIAAGLQRAGVTRVGTWISPSHDKLTYRQNFKRHAARLKQIAQILSDHGLRLGLEYVGTPTLRFSKRFAFVHTMAETKELIDEIGTGNVGFVLDTWHWWTAGETAADILTLRADQIVAVDLNDAPAGIPLAQQMDNRRELPAATGVIDAAAFLTALRQLGYDGPVRAEPFNRPLNDLDNESACAAVIQALRKAFSQIPPDSQSRS